MLRSLLLAGSISAALFSPAVPAQTTLELIEAGAAPRQQVRYQYQAGRAERAAMDINMQLALSLGGMQMPMGAVPPIQMILSLRTAEVATDGSAKMEFEIVSAEARGDDPQATQINQSLQGARGLSGWYRVDTRGQIKDGQLNAPPGGAPAGGADLLEDFETTMQQMAAPFPDEAIGPGARWRMTQHVTNNNMKMSQTAEYTLRARNGNRVELDVKMLQASIQDIAGLPPGTKVDSVRMQGGGTNAMQLDRLVPTSSVEADIAIALSLNVQGMTQNMDMNMKMRQGVTPAAD